MPSIFTRLSLTLALGLGLASGVSLSPAIAQNSEGSEAQTEAAEAPDATQSTEAEAAAADGASEEGAPAERVVAVHSDWQIRCRTENDECFMYQLAIDAREVPIAEVSIVPLNAEDGRVAGFTIVTPLRTLLPEGVTLQIDNGSQQRYQFGWCTEAGCAARFAVRQDGLDQFKRGNKARLTVFSVERPDAPVILDVSLAGFTAAFTDLAAR